TTSPPTPPAATAAASPPPRACSPPSRTTRSAAEARVNVRCPSLCATSSASRFALTPRAATKPQQPQRAFTLARDRPRAAHFAPARALLCAQPGGFDAIALGHSLGRRHDVGLRRFTRGH